MKIKDVLFLILFISSCTKESGEEENILLENYKRGVKGSVESRNMNDDINQSSKIIFYINDDIALYESQLINKMGFPCKEKTILPKSIKQLPNAQYYLLNKEIQESGINFQCLPEAKIYPVAKGIVVDIEKNNNFDITLDNEMYNIATRLIDKLGYMPNDIRHIFYENYITIDHGFYFSNEFRTISIYSNLKEISEDVEIGQKIDTNTFLGFIENDKIYPLSATLLRNEQGELEVQKDILNFEMYFENKEGTFHIGQGVKENILPDYYNSFFSDQK